MAGANHGKGDAWVAKYNNSGNLMWKRQLGSSYYDVSAGVGTDSNGNVYISGTTNGSLAGAIQGYQDDVWVAKYSNSGNLMWKRQLGSSGSEYFVDVATDSNGNVYISGSTSLPFAGAIQGYQYDAWVAKYNNSGDLMWKRQLEISSDEFSSGVAIDSNGNVYISGNTYDLFGEEVHESWLIKILSN